MASTAITLDEAIYKYLAHREARVSATTLKGDKAVLTRFSAWYGKCQMRHVRQEKVADWFTEIRGEHRTREHITRKGISERSHNRYREVLGVFFTWTQRRGWVKVDLLMEVEPLRVPRRPRLQPDAATLLSLPEHTENSRDRAVLAVLVNSGFRAATARELRVGDVDLAGGWLTAEISKTKEIDLFPISLDLHHELVRWLRDYALWIERPLRPEDYLLPSRTTGTWGWESAQDGTKVRKHLPGVPDPARPLLKPEKVVQKALRAAGIEFGSGEGAHTLRRALARAIFDARVAEGGHDATVREVSALLHHKDSSTTERYLGLHAERERRNEMMRGKPLLSAMVQSQDAEVINLR